MRSLIFLIMILVTPFDLYAQPKEVPLEAYGKLPSKSMMVISPNAERMAYRDTSNGRDIMMIIDLKTGAALAAVDVSTVKPDNVYFIDNERLIFVVSKNKRIRGYRGRHDISAAFAYNLNTKKIHQLLTQGYGIYSGQSQLGNIIGISSDKKYAYMPAWKNLGSYNLYKVNLDKPRKPRVYRKGTSDTIDFFLDENGEVLARERYNNENDLHRIEALIDGDWQEIFRQETPYRTKGFSGLTPDRKSLVMLSQDDEHGRWAYYTMSLSDGSISEPIFSHKDKDVEQVLTDIHRVVHGVRYSGFTPTYEFFDKKLNARMRGLKKALPNNTFNINDYTPDWSSMVFYMDGEMSSGDYVLYQNGSLGMLAAARPDIPVEAVHPVTEYSFQARDGLTIPTLITTPIGQPAKNLPAIMLPHGGPESYDKLGFDWMTQYFASQGYLVIQPQFRGSKGFGPEHQQKGRGEWGRKMQNDLTDAVNDLAAKGRIDKNRVCIVGSSYGGYAALSGATFTPNLYKCVISINGVSDVEQMLETEERDHGDDHWVVSYWQDVISKGDVKEDHLEKISPINYVKDVVTPILLIHGERDQIVPLSQSEDMFDELEDANKNVTFVELEEGDHHLSNAKNRMKALKAIDKFIKENI
ncbi:prolyl oligopeptidase family serine peptidase [Thalassotalea nanhaiensis]|uniref:Prolyl oligopeptidase family serine peptidase n=1 Tax=Thalassotalea nanhaiensis TaxID=3065648 RepID=A0ABY9TM15_9GAMM|nr:prolyl oligopeptidase family serine peptidase [Colwelliaceae bacterium SQ345]